MLSETQRTISALGCCQQGVQITSVTFFVFAWLCNMLFNEPSRRFSGFLARISRVLPASLVASASWRTSSPKHNLACFRFRNTFESMQATTFDMIYRGNGFKEGIDRHQALNSLSSASQLSSGCSGTSSEADKGGDDALLRWVAVFFLWGFVARLWAVQYTKLIFIIDLLYGWLPACCFRRSCSRCGNRESRSVGRRRTLAVESSVSSTGRRLTPLERCVGRGGMARADKRVNNSAPNLSHHSQLSLRTDERNSGVSTGPIDDSNSQRSSLSIA